MTAEECFEEILEFFNGRKKDVGLQSKSGHQNHVDG